MSSGTIIGEGDPKSWDPHAPMIWENLVIYWVAVGGPSNEMGTGLSPTLHVKKWLNWAIATQKAMCVCFVSERLKNLFLTIGNCLHSVSFKSGNFRLTL